jgi:proteasome assembly chaperone (PAC2) family protein
MNSAVQLWERPTTEEIYLLAGWHQWADAGNISSGLPQYLIDQTDARPIGQIKDDGYYLFQVPGAHHFLRPEIKLEDGYRQHIESYANNLYYTELQSKGLVIFLGHEPHLRAEHYIATLLDATQALRIRRVVALGGVYGAIPYDKDRNIHCVYSLPRMQEELQKFGVVFSNYEGGTTIGTYLVDQAEKRGLEVVDLYAFVPAYDFSDISQQVQGLRIDSDFKAWHEVMHRVKHMFDLALDLSDLEQQSEALVASLDAKIAELDRQAPQLRIRDYLERLNREFTEVSFLPLDDLWERELGDLLTGMDR